MALIYSLNRYSFLSEFIIGARWGGAQTPETLSIKRIPTAFALG
jgi:hypothetical protein